MVGGRAQWSVHGDRLFPASTLVGRCRPGAMRAATENQAYDNPDRYIILWLTKKFPKY